MIFILTILLGMLSSQGQAPKTAIPTRPVRVVFETELGKITFEVDTEHAPVTAANFLQYVDGGFYNGGEFHRSVRPDTEVRQDAPIQVIQARINPAREKDEFPPIPIERTDTTEIG